MEKYDNSNTRSITSTQLNWLLEGLEFEQNFKEKQLLI